MFSSRSFTILCFTFRSMIQLLLIFVKGVRFVFRSIFLHVDVRLFPHHLFKRLPLLHRTASTLHKYSQGVFDYICVSVSGLSLLFIDLFVYSFANIIFFWLLCLYKVLKSGSVSLSTLFFSFNIGLAILGLCLFV